MEKTDVLILAGGTLPEDLKKYSAGFDNRALLKINGKYMIEYVIDALRGVPEIGEILVVGLKEPLEQALGDRVSRVVSAKDSMLDNLQLGLDGFKGCTSLIITTCDIPLVDSGSVSRFLAACKKKTCDIYYPLIEKSLNQKKYPSTKRTYFRLKEGVFTGGNIVLVNPEGFRRNWGYIEKILESRKSPLKIIGMIGVGFIIRFLLHRLDIPLIEKTIERVAGMKGTAVMVQDPEIGIDVDKESDYLLVKELLEKN